MKPLLQKIIMLGTFSLSLWGLTWLAKPVQADIEPEPAYAQAKATRVPAYRLTLQDVNRNDQPQTVTLNDQAIMVDTADHNIQQALRDPKADPNQVLIGVRDPTATMHELELMTPQTFNESYDHADFASRATNVYNWLFVAGGLIVMVLTWFLWNASGYQYRDYKLTLSSFIVFTIAMFMITGIAILLVGYTVFMY